MPIYLNDSQIGEEIPQKINNHLLTFHLKNNSYNAELITNINNTIKIINSNGELIYEYIIYSNLENLEHKKSELQENEFIYNIDPYEELTPIKYSIIKKNNKIYLKDLICTKVI